MDIPKDENEEMKEIPLTDTEKEKMVLTQENFPKFLQEVGLETPIDYVFNNYAMIQSRKRIENGPQDQLIFLFHLVTFGATTQSQRGNFDIHTFGTVSRYDPTIVNV